MKSKALDKVIISSEVPKGKSLEVRFEAYRGRLPEFGTIAVAFDCQDIGLGTRVTDKQRRELPFDPLAWLQQHIPRAEWTFERDVSLRATECFGRIPLLVDNGNSEDAGLFGTG